MINLMKSPVRFDEEEHRYWLGETELQGITSTLIRRAFPDKYKDVDPEVLANAAAKGHALHTAIEVFDEFGGDPDLAGDDRVKLYADMKEEYGLTRIANEYLVSDEEHYASSIDIVMMDSSDRILLFDIKTTWNLDKASTGLQLSIYKRWFERQNPDLKVSGIYVLWLPNKDHTICEVHELSVVDGDTIDALIEADQNDEPFNFVSIPEEWAMLEKWYKNLSAMKDDTDKNLAEVKQRMMEIMQRENAQTIRTDLYTVSYIEAKTTKRFDSTTFKKENKEMYDKYMKDVETAAQIRVLPKKIETNND